MGILKEAGKDKGKEREELMVLVRFCNTISRMLLGKQEGNVDAMVARVACLVNIEKLYNEHQERGR